MQGFRTLASDGLARRGAIETAHGPVSTPAFVPLATRGAVKTLTPHEVEGLGYEMVLGNAYHLELRPGAEFVGARGGIGRFMGWRRAVITDSGGFQVFSLGHGGVADEVKGSGGRSARAREGVVKIDENGVSFRSYVDGRRKMFTPERSMEIQAALGSDIALAFDECTPFHASRDYTARSTERTHRWLDRCLAWQERHGVPGQSLFGIVQGGTHRDLRAESTEFVQGRGVAGIAIGGTLGRDKDQMREVVGWVTAAIDRKLPCHLLGIGEVDDVLIAVSQGVDTFDCAVPTRIARHGMALVADPSRRFRLDLGKAAAREDDRPIDDSCACEACRGSSRAYIAYLLRAGEMTGIRMLTLHNLAFMAELMRGIRRSIVGGRFRSYSASVLGGTSPWVAGGSTGGGGRSGP